MPQSLIINSATRHVRVALVDETGPLEVYVERRGERGVVGNIYRGKVVRVLPGMQAAFVNIGLERTAFLYVDDASPYPPPLAAAGPRPRRGLAGQPGPATTAAAGELALTPAAPSSTPREGSETEAAAVADDSGTAAALKTATGDDRKRATIGQLLSPGQEILVQVQKAPLGGKGARLTRHVSLPGRYLVYTPLQPHLGISQRIDDLAERERLRQLMTAAGPGGWIVRTAAAAMDAEILTAEAQALRQQWQTIEAAGQGGATPRLLYAELDMMLRLVRELLAPQVSQVVVDSAADAARLRQFIAQMGTGMEDRVQEHTGMTPIFSQHGVEAAIAGALTRQCWLPSGGTLVIDLAEALTVIDVNSGRFVGRKDLEATATTINLEAAHEVARQLRLRNLGGIIIVDFIDMQRSDNRERVLAALAEALRPDRARPTIVQMTALGLVELTRKRVRESLTQALSEPCPTCQQRGTIRSPDTLAQDVLRALEISLIQQPGSRQSIRLHPRVAHQLATEDAHQLATLAAAHAAQVELQPRPDFGHEQFSLHLTPTP